MSTTKSLVPSQEAPKLRAFCARNNVRYKAIADHLGVHRSYVSRVMRADETNQAVSAEQLDRIWNAVLHLAREREGSRK